MINESQKYPANKHNYDRNYLRIFGVVCPSCQGKERGICCKDGSWTTCPECDGLGYIEKK